MTTAFTDALHRHTGKIAITQMLRPGADDEEMSYRRRHMITAMGIELIAALGDGRDYAVTITERVQPVLNKPDLLVPFNGWESQQELVLEALVRLRDRSAAQVGEVVVPEAIVSPHDQVSLTVLVGDVRVGDGHIPTEQRTFRRLKEGWERID